MTALADVVTVGRRFRRSVRLGSDSSTADVEGFVCTATAAQALETTIDHVRHHGHCAFTWTGPYGCGKSTLALILAASLGPEGAVRDLALNSLPAALRDHLLAGMGWDAPGWTVVPIVGRRDNPEVVLGEALHERKIGGHDPIAAAVKAAELADGPGLLLIIDEMGKLLDHAAGSDGDAHFFQELAEAASRSAGRLVVVGVLHQAFDDYAYRLARESRDSWLKVQGRFVDVPLAPTAEEQVELLSQAISSKPPAQIPSATIVAEAVGRTLGSREVVEDRLRRCWPLNPVVACLLGPLSRRRFGQNQRSIFGFLGSAEPLGFQDFLRSTSADEDRLYDPVWLWGYLRANLEPSILASPDGHRWSIAVDAVERVEDRGADPIELDVLKTVALLDLLRERSGLLATPRVIAAGLGVLVADVECALELLVRRSSIVFRRHLGAYAVFAGSDFDIEAAVEEARTGMVGCDYGRLRATGVLTPILAKREYHETGSMRWFEVDLATLEEAENRVSSFQPGAGAAGLFLLLINEGGERTARVRRRLAKLAELVGDRPIAFGVSGDSYMLRELSHELVALERVQSSRPELKGDAVARREVASRLARLAGELEDRLRSSLTVTRWVAPAIAEEELCLEGGAGGLSLIASRLAASLYPLAPRIRNELVNRSKPSSNAVAAVRALMTAMVLKPDEARLGIKDFPPEGGLYASILERAGLHREGADGRFTFVEPSEDEEEHRLAPLWTAGRGLLERGAGEGMTLADLFGLWRERPFGVKDGLLPVLGTAFLLSIRDRVSIYLDGVFCSDVNDLLVDRLLQDHDAVRLRLSTVSPRDTAILRGVGDLVAELGGGMASVTADPLVIGRQLVALVLSAPGWVRRTARLGPEARRVRDLAQAAHDPNKFMLDDLPRIAGKGADVEEVVAVLRRGLATIAAAYSDLLDSLGELLMCELRAGADEQGLERLRMRARSVMGISGNYRLDAFAARLSSFDGSSEAIEGLASLAANRPPRDWVDRDVDAARVELAALSREFLRTEGLAHVQGRGLGRFSFALFMSDPARSGLLTSEVTVDGEDLERGRVLARSLRAIVGEKVGREVALAAALELAAGIAEEIGGGAAVDAEPVQVAGGGR